MAEQNPRPDWSKAVRGRHVDKGERATALMRMLDDDLAKDFPSSESVNAALRQLLEIRATLRKKSA
jgi:hypothetical protein